MKQHSFKSHAPAEMRRLSNLAHIVEGTLIAIVGILVLLGKQAGFTWASSTWPVLILVAGVGLLFFLYPLHPVSEWSLIWQDAQQRQHTIIAVAIAIAGLAELLSSSVSVLRYPWPMAIILSGGMFLFHEQHGTSEAAARAVQQHRALGSALFAAGLLNLVEIISGARFAALLWPILLIVAAVQLLVYREPEGAYESEEGHGKHTGHKAA